MSNALKKSDGAAEPVTRAAVVQDWYANEGLHKMLTASAADGHLCHAYFFFGAGGIGKKTLAAEFARAILCRGEKPPCNRCASCEKVLTGNHPDLWIYEGKGGANSIHIETIRMLRQDAYIKPNDGAFKVYFLSRAEDMSINAANAFLKVLEEPPAHAVFLLTADSREQVPETILSRCLQLQLFPWTEAQVLAALRAGFPERKAEELRSAADYSGGIIGHAVWELNSEDFRDIGELARRTVEGLSWGSEYEVLAGLNGANQSKERMNLLLERLMSLLRAVLLCKLSARPARDALEEGLAFRLTSAQIAAAAGLLEEARAAVDGNANLGLLTNCLSANLMQAAGA